MPNNFPREDMHQMVTAEDIARLEAVSLPNNTFVTHEDHLGGKVRSSLEADIQGIVTRGHRALARSSQGLRNSISKAAKPPHVVNFPGLKAEMNKKAAVQSYDLGEDI
jgi:hypothetical protein